MVQQLVELVRHKPGECYIFSWTVGHISFSVRFYLPKRLPQSCFFFLIHFSYKCFIVVLTAPLLCLHQTGSPAVDIQTKHSFCLRSPSHSNLRPNVPA